jgi:hypothetical protein
MILFSAITSNYVGDIETHCYDKYGHEIINQTCIKEVYCDKLNEWGNSCPINKTNEEEKLK